MERRVSRANWHAASLLILAVALLLRLLHLDWGLPMSLEEALPLKQAVEMWNWDGAGGPTLNPRFFNYPSLVIYIHFLAQGLLFGILRAFDVLGSGGEHFARYLIDPSSMYLLSRLISVLFAAGSVWLIMLTGKRLPGRYTGSIAGILLALCAYHIARSQMIEVDIPLTFFALLSIFLGLRLIEKATLRRSVFLGVAIGLATSTKYTGICLLLPGVACFIFAHRKGRADTLPKCSPLLSILAMLTAFFATSPYVLLDTATFMEHLANERQHMRLGHFGLTGSSSLAFYLGALWHRLLAWPAAILTIFGFIRLGLLRRSAAVVVIGAFVIPYLAVLSFWEMHADRYLLPMVPLCLLLCAAAIGDISSYMNGLLGRRYTRLTTVVILSLACCLPWLSAYRTHIETIGSDTRNTSAKWIRDHIPSGSLLVMEQYGPELYSPQIALKLRPAIAKQVRALAEGLPFHGLLHIPMFQVMPERSGVFYDFDLYSNADYFLTSSAISSRYEAKPELFADQVRFYEQLGRAFSRIAVFEPRSEGGNTITIYKNTRHQVPFGARPQVLPPRPVAMKRGSATGSEELFYFELGTAFEVEGHVTEAIDSYDMALRYPVRRDPVFRNTVLRRTACTLSLGNRRDTQDYLSAVAEQAPSASTQAWVRSLARRIAETTK